MHEELSVNNQDLKDRIIELKKLQSDLKKHRMVHYHIIFTSFRINLQKSQTEI